MPTLLSELLSAIPTRTRLDPLNTAADTPSSPGVTVEAKQFPALRSSGTSLGPQRPQGRVRSHPKGGERLYPTT
jgi:hypothetical protein